MEQEIRDNYDKKLIIDGILYEITEEPKYVINTFGLGHNHGSTAMFIENCYNPNISKHNYFNALQRNEAIKYGKDVALRRGDTDSIDRIGSGINIEVLIPEAVKANPMNEAGDGDSFINNAEQIISNSNDALEAGLLLIATL